MACHKIITYYELESKLQMLKFLSTCCTRTAEMQRQQSAPWLINRLMAHIWTDNGSSQAEWITWAMARQGRKNLEEIFRFGFSNRKRSEPDLTTQAFVEAIGTFLFLTPTSRICYSLYSSMHDHSELTWASSETKIRDFVLTSCLQARIRISCMPFLLQCFCNPALCDCTKGKHISG